MDRCFREHASLPVSNLTHEHPLQSISEPGSPQCISRRPMIWLSSFSRRRWTIPLDALRQKHLGQAGAKAVNLGRMMRAGLPVPKGFVLKAGAFQQFLDSVPERAQFERWLTESRESDAAIEQLSRRIQSTLAHHPVAATIQFAVQSALDQFPDVPLWAVRSSGTAEDSAERSFAGQHDSFLNVRRHQVLVSIRDCWVSFFNLRAIRYRLQKQVPPDAGMAVIIQAMVPAASAGVLFTADPASGNRNRLVIEAARGLAQALVSGHIEPERLVLARYSVDVLDFESSSSSCSSSSFSPGRNEDFREPTTILDHQTARALARLGLRAEQLLKAPLDIEWAITADGPCLLQARPITGLPPQTWEDRQVWSNINAGENLPDVVSPLAWSLLQHFLDPVLGSVFRLCGADTRKGTFLGLVAGHVYFNVNSVWAAIKPFWSVVKGIPNLMVALGAGHVPPGDEQLLDFPDADLPDLGFRWPKYLLSLPRQMLEWLAHSPSRADAWTLRLVARGREAAKIDVDSMSVPELLKCVKRLVYESLDGWDLLYLGPQGVSLVIFQKACRDWLHQPLSKGYRLFAALGGVPEAEAGLALWSLAALAHADAETEQLLRSGASWTEVQAPLAKTQHGQAFLEAWAAFMTEHGHHGRGEIDVFSPRWFERPDYILGIVRSYLATFDQCNPVQHHQRLAEERQRFTQQCLHSLRNPIKRWIFARALARAQKLAVSRELWKNEAVRVLAVLRRVLLRLGAALHDQRRLADPEDIFFLEIGELEPVVSGKAPFDVQAVIRQRRAEYARNLPLNPPPLVAGRFVPAQRLPSPEPRPDAHALKGIPVSPGTVTGRARVILRNDDHQQLLPGEVLVAPFTDPAWTPYFIPAAGLVTEQGGILSHGSIIAREYGIPAVSSVRSATSLIRTGDLLEIDGHAGLVRIRPVKSSSSSCS